MGILIAKMFTHATGGGGMALRVVSFCLLGRNWGKGMRSVFSVFLCLSSNWEIQLNYFPTESEQIFRLGRLSGNLIFPAYYGTLSVKQVCGKVPPNLQLY